MSSGRNWIEFQDLWAGLALKSLTEEEKQLPLSAVSADVHLWPKAERISLDQVLAVELNWISRLLNQSYIQVTQFGSVQSRSLFTGSSTRLLVVEVDQVSVVELNFRTIEPVQHSSRSVEEASNLGMLWVELVPEQQQWLNCSTHSAWTFEFKDVWAGPTSKSLSGISGHCAQWNQWHCCCYSSRSISGGIGSNRQLNFWISGQLNLSCIQVA